jgi:hypothetical protein
MINASRSIHHRVCWTIVGVISAYSLLLTSQVTAGEPADSHVVPVNSNAFGLSYGEWSARLTQWLFSLPVDHHPLFDTADCSTGQTGNVWFLGGTFTLSTVGGVVIGEVTRNCTIPPGKALCLPIIGGECSTLEGNGTTEAELRDCAQTQADLIEPDSLFCVIDGKPVSDLARFRVQSPLFTIGPLPDNNILGVTAGAIGLSVGDGYSVLVKPLPVGKHTLHFGGMADLRPLGGPIFIQDITYNLTVAP